MPDDTSADPFAGPSLPGTQPAPARPNTTPATQQVPQPFTRTTPPDTDTGTGDRIACPCACRCGNLTDKTYEDVESISAARFLRCGPCAAAMHFGPQWNVETTQPDMGEADIVVTGKSRYRTDDGSTTFVIRRPHKDPEDEAIDREIAEQLENERREAAQERWLESLPERWKMPYTDGEELEPPVEERLERLRRGKTHGTSLVCYGPFGSGKTWVAYTYARAAVDRRLLWPQEIRVGTEAEIMEPLALASPWEVAPRAAELLKPSLRMLVIDDVGALGTYKNPENRYATWAKVINWMYEHNRTLVITTNKPLGAEENTPEAERDDLLVRWIGPTAYERLKHMVGRRQVYRVDNKRGEMAARWEAEYQAMKATQGKD